MKKVLFSLALAVCALTAGAASVTAPEAGNLALLTAGTESEGEDAGEGYYIRIICSIFAF